MIFRQETRSANAAEQLMAIEVFADLLAATTPEQMGKKLTEQLRELTGARTVVLASHPQDAGEPHRVLNTCPEKRFDIFGPHDLDLLCPKCARDAEELHRLTKDFPTDSPIRALLERKGVASILRFMLVGEGQMIGMILLLDLPGMGRIDETVTIVNHLSPVIALALKNAQSFDHSERTVERRTAELLEVNRELTRMLQEKETLIREIYHRTKNTLQVVGAMLNLQAEKFLANGEVRQVVQMTNQRIQAISLVHELLYQSQDLSQISIKEYLDRLTGLIMDSQRMPGLDIRLCQEVEDSLFLIDTIVPIGLVVTELLTNSFKHAYPGRSSGRIGLTLTIGEASATHIRYTDDGVGLPDNFDTRKQESLGMSLVTNIVEKQLSGIISFPAATGFCCDIVVPATQYTRRV